MAATEESLTQEKKAEFKCHSLASLTFNALLTNAGFFKTREAPYPDLIECIVSEKLSYYVGFGMRTKAETIFKSYPKSLLRRFTFTDIAKDNYENSTVFEYAVRVKDSYFVKKVVNFLETYPGEDRYEIVTSLIEQFDKCFSEQQLASVTRFINACQAWATASGDSDNRSLAERDEALIQNIGESQAKFPAHILHEYCHTTNLFDPTLSFSKDELPECLNFYHGTNYTMESLLVFSPGVLSNFALLCYFTGVVGVFSLKRKDDGLFWGTDCLQQNSAAMKALDAARTTDLSKLKERLVSIRMAENSHESQPPVATTGFSV